VAIQCHVITDQFKAASTLSVVGGFERYFNFIPMSSFQHLLDGIDTSIRLVEIQSL